MIQAEYKFKLGTDEYTIRADVATQTEFFETMAFYASLPKVGPNGETDLKLTHRKVKDYDYYSVVCQSAGKEFLIGQYKGDKGAMFAKDWEPLYQGSTEQGAEAQVAAPAQAAPAANRFPKPATAAPKLAAAVTPPVLPTETQTAPAATAKATPAPVAVGSKMQGLMAKYGATKTGSATPNIRR